MTDTKKSIRHLLKKQIEEYEKMYNTSSSDFEKRYLKGAINAVKVSLASINVIFAVKEAEQIKKGK